MLVPIALLTKHFRLALQLILHILAPVLQCSVILLYLLDHAVQPIVLDRQLLDGLPALVDLSLKRCKLADDVVLPDIIEPKLADLTSESVDFFVHLFEVIRGGCHIFAVLLVFLPGACHLFLEGEDVIVQQLDLFGVGLD